MNKTLILALALGISINFFGCSLAEKKEPSNTKEATAETSAMLHNERNPSSSVKSLFTGEEISSTVKDQTPFMVVIENSKSARPQSGLNDADIVYETMAEGGISRFIALFQKNDAKVIGPVRSLRPYFIDISEEYNLPFAHCGGSDEALACVKSENLMSMDEMANSSSYWRDSVRKAPHNLYTSSSKITSTINKKSFSNIPTCNLKFDKDYWSKDSLEECNYIELPINRYYKTSYTFNNGKYYKVMDDEAAIDRETGSPIGFKNVVIQLTKITLNKDGKHVDIDLNGSGNGFVLSNGKIKSTKWYKEKDSTVLKDDTGNTIPLNPGNTIWNIIDSSTKIAKN